MEFRYSRALSVFVADPGRLRAFLNETSSTVSGSLAVAVASGHPFPPNDLDVYTGYDTVQEVVHFFETSEGFRVKGNLDPFASGYRGGISHIIRLTKGSVSIDVVVSHTASATLPITFFWSTTVMTYFSGDGVCIPYPTWLESSRGLLNPGRSHMDPEVLSIVKAKYDNRGFDIRPTEEDWGTPDKPIPPCKQDRSPTCPVTTRYFGDNFSLFTSLGSISSRIKTPPFSGTLAILTNIWWRGGSGCGGPCTSVIGTEFEAWTQTADVVGLGECVD